MCASISLLHRDVHNGERGMKRSTTSLPLSPDPQKSKKAKLSPDTSDNEPAAGWTKVEKRKKKKAQKAEASMQPRFMYSNGDILQRQKAIGVEEIRDLALHIIADAPPPNWIRVEVGAVQVIFIFS